MILILGGTTEGLELARVLDGRAMMSLAGRTASPILPPGPVRVGGFGGAQGLADYLAAESISAVVDCTHPFAARISAHAVTACALVGVPLLRLERPVWEKQPGDQWIMAADMAEAASLAKGRAFLTVGSGEVAAFAASNAWFLVRLLAQAALPLREYQVVLGKPGDAEAEARLMRENRIEMLITKQSGGSDGKIRAARELGIPVLMVRRPVLPPAEIVSGVAGALAWLKEKGAR